MGSTQAHTPQMDRRPLASRSWPVMRRLAAFLARAGVSPNGISGFGMVCGVLAGVCFWATGQWAAGETISRLTFALAAGLIQLRLLCNLIDGMVAVEGGRQSPTGEIWNEVPDRISDICTIVGAGYALSGWPLMGPVAALVAVLTAYIRAVGKGAGLPSDFRGPMAKPHRMALLTGAALAMAALPRHWMIWDGPIHGLMGAALCAVALGAALTCLRRLARIASALKERAA